MAVAVSKEQTLSVGEILQKAGKRALGGGLPGAAAMFCQVMTLMWLRTTVNYQYRNGTSTLQALRTLYKDGGIPRFYKGVGWALVQGPVSRFGDTAANTGALAVFESVPSLQNTPVAIKTICASFTAACFRILLTPIDTMKTMNQVQGARAGSIIAEKIRASGPGVMYNGAFGAAAATMVSLRLRLIEEKEKSVERCVLIKYVFFSPCPLSLSPLSLGLSTGRPLSLVCYVQLLE